MERAITISREFGSGGRELGVRLAESLGIPFYDKELISMAAEESDMPEDAFLHYDENMPLIKDPLDRHFYSPFSSIYQVPMSDQIFLAQSRVIRKLAEEQSCVIVGRCADYVLEDADNIELVRIFIYSDMDARIRRVKEKELYAPEDIKKNVKRIDKERRNYYRYYTGRGWADPENYDLLINTSTAGIKGSVRMIEEYIKIRGYKI